MKRFFALLLCLVFVAGFAAAEDLSSLSFEDLVALQRAVVAEIMSRPEWKEVTVPGGEWVVGVDIPAGVYCISAGKSGGYIEVKNGQRSVLIQGIRDEAHKIGRIELLDGYVVEIERGSLIFSPAVGLGF